MSLKDAIREAAEERNKQQNKQAVNTASNKAVQQLEEEATEFAAMTIRVPKRHRVHWLICAKKEGTTLTAAVIEGLTARYGEPTE